MLRVSEESSDSAAARTLAPHPWTNHKVTPRLESRLGVRWFHRTSRELKFTPEGERLLSSAHQVVSAEEATEVSRGADTALAAGGVLRGSITVMSEDARMGDSRVHT